MSNETIIEILNYFSSDGNSQNAFLNPHDAQDVLLIESSLMGLARQIKEAKEPITSIIFDRLINLALYSVGEISTAADACIVVAGRKWPELITNEKINELTNILLTEDDSYHPSAVLRIRDLIRLNPDRVTLDLEATLKKIQDKKHIEFLPNLLASVRGFQRSRKNRTLAKLDQA